MLKKSPKFAQISAFEALWWFSFPAKGWVKFWPAAGAKKIRIYKFKPIFQRVFALNLPDFSFCFRLRRAGGKKTQKPYTGRIILDAGNFPGGGGRVVRTDFGIRAP